MKLVSLQKLVYVRTGSLTVIEWEAVLIQSNTPARFRKDNTRVEVDDLELLWIGFLGDALK